MQHALLRAGRPQPLLQAVWTPRGGSAVVCGGPYRSTASAAAGGLGHLLRRHGRQGGGRRAADPGWLRAGACRWAGAAAGRLRCCRRCRRDRLSPAAGRCPQALNVMPQAAPAWLACSAAGMLRIPLAAACQRSGRSWCRLQPHTAAAAARTCPPNLLRSPASPLCCSTSSATSVWCGARPSAPWQRCRRQTAACTRCPWNGTCCPSWRWVGRGPVGVGRTRGRQAAASRDSCLPAPQLAAACGPRVAAAGSAQPGPGLEDSEALPRGVWQPRGAGALAPGRRLPAHHRHPAARGAWAGRGGPAPPGLARGGEPRRGWLAGLGSTAHGQARAWLWLLSMGGCPPTPRLRCSCSRGEPMRAHVLQITALFVRHGALLRQAVAAPDSLRRLFEWLQRDLGLPQPAIVKVLNRVPLILQVRRRDGRRRRAAAAWQMGRYWHWYWYWYWYRRPAAHGRPRPAWPAG